MATAVIREGFGARPGRIDRFPGVAALAIALVVVPGPGSAAARDGSVGPRAGDTRYCSATARSLHYACRHEVRDDHWVETAICLNLADAAERDECIAARDEARREGRQLCREQHKARREVCALLGEDRYAPAFDPASFDADFTALTHPNPRLPLAIGNAWEYRGGDEVVTVEVLDEAKLIEGVRCIVVRDRVTRSGELVEDTDDWLAQALDGDVWYCGEEVKDFESFDGDAPRRPELVSIDGSFKAGRDRAKAGILLPAAPSVGEVYREEFSLGDAEDLAEVLSVTYAYGADAELDRLVPRALAELLCAGDCMVTRNFSPLEPDAVARKYYATGLGAFLEVVPETGEIVQLTGCNFDSRCALLPSP